MHLRKHNLLRNFDSNTKFDNTNTNIRIDSLNSYSCYRSTISIVNDGTQTGNKGNVSQSVQNIIHCNDDTSCQESETYLSIDNSGCLWEYVTATSRWICYGYTYSPTSSPSNAPSAAPTIEPTNFLSVAPVVMIIIVILKINILSHRYWIYGTIGRYGNAKWGGRG